MREEVKFESCYHGNTGSVAHDCHVFLIGQSNSSSSGYRTSSAGSSSSSSRVRSNATSGEKAKRPSLFLSVGLFHTCILLSRRPRGSFVAGWSCQLFLSEGISAESCQGGEVRHTLWGTRTRRRRPFQNHVERRKKDIFFNTTAPRYEN